MTETLFDAYLPLILWTSVGLLCFRFLPHTLPRLLGRSLYWVGIPIEILALARQTDFSQSVGLPPIITFAALLLGLGVAVLCLQILKKLAFLPIAAVLNTPAIQGSFILAAVLGNTGFVGLAIAPAFIDHSYLNWIVFYSLTHNLIGTYGFGVFIASYFAHETHQNHWWVQLRDVLTVPTLWTFLLGYLTRDVELPSLVESGLQASIGIVIPCAFLLTGMRLTQLRGWKSLKLAVIPALLKVVVIPGLVGILTTLFLGLSGDRRLAVVLMSGMPSAFAGLIFAEEYNLERELVASCIVVSTVLLLLVLPLWLFLFQ
ncbi:AEC family transporter [Gloeocapsopsis crepidinum LEGE 06123]|uniref:AEC family transporter n=1 Tax=Gloeocapsopsis crepidinum LEGE 06123 TaxID=588587 RepID=A0ABR9UXZ9_9CHRO|nr:AEC family transporter [Gloeocapsopsis crepidinum]MBE9192860.1 AEC family transporter [Gloeocapsopsis crepidinum LEGE 06123]